MALPKDGHWGLGLFVDLDLARFGSDVHDELLAEPGADLHPEQLALHQRVLQHPASEVVGLIFSFPEIGRGLHLKSCSRNVFEAKAVRWHVASAEHAASAVEEQVRVVEVRGHSAQIRNRQFADGLGHQTLVHGCLLLVSVHGC